MNTGIKVEFCIMKRFKEKSLTVFFLLSSPKEQTVLFPRSLLPATGPGHPSLEGILKSVSWPFLTVQNVFSFMPCVWVGRRGAALAFCGVRLCRVPTSLDRSPGKPVG